MVGCRLILILVEPRTRVGRFLLLFLPVEKIVKKNFAF